MHMDKTPILQINGPYLPHMHDQRLLNTIFKMTISSATSVRIDPMIPHWKGIENRNIVV
jgi:hypothetical protein